MDSAKVTSNARFNVNVSNLKQQAVQGAAATGVSQACCYFLRFGSTIVLARLLTPADFGLIAMASAVIAFLSYGGDFGLSQATIQKPDVTHSQLSALFWTNVALGILLAVATAASAPLLAWFYNEDRLVWITYALATAFVFKGLTVQHHAILTRMMRFKALAVVQIVSILAGVILAVFAALFGLGYWSLVMLYLGTQFISLVAVWGLCDWRPGIPRDRAGVGQMLTFGGNLTAFNFMTALTRHLDQILIGGRWGAHQLGLYTKAFQLVLVPLGQIFMPLGNVVVPALSRLQDDVPRYRRYYGKIISLLAYTTMPVLVVIGVMAEEIVLLVLGSKWQESAVILQVLCIAAFGRPIVYASHWVCISTGKAKRLAQWGLISTPLICASFLIGLPWGPVGVALAYTVCVHALNFPTLWFLFRSTPVSVGDAVGAFWRPALASAAIWPALWLVKGALSEPGSWDGIIITLLSGLAAFLVVLIGWPKARAEAFELIAHVKMLKARALPVNPVVN
jgi:O-antigen/teichoic acid export membrane protein